MNAFQANGVKNMPVHIMPFFTKCFAVDVRGTAEEVSGVDDFSLDKVIEELIASSKMALKNRHQLALQRLVLEVVLPFYEEHAKLGLLQDFRPGEHEAAINVPQKARVLDTVLEAGYLALMGIIPEEGSADGGRTRSKTKAGTWGAGDFANQAIKKIREKINQEQMRPLLEEHHDQAGSRVIDRWERDTGFQSLYFYEYRRPRARQLGMDLASANPQDTLLTDVLVPEMARQSVLPLQNFLRSLRDDLIRKPMHAMAKTIEDVFNNHIKPTSSVGHASTINNVIDAVHETVHTSLRAWRDQEVGKLNILFDQLLQSLEIERVEILRTVMLSHVSKVGKSFSSQKTRKVALAKKSYTIAETVARKLLDYTQADILQLLHQRMIKSFRQITNSTHGLVYAAVKKGDTHELVRSGAFKIAQYYARYTAGLVSGLMRSSLVYNQLQTYHKIDSIMQLSEQPPLVTGGKQNLASILQCDELEFIETVDGTVSGGEASSSYSIQGLAGNGWNCPNCRCSETETISKEPLRTANVPCMKTQGCFCEGLPVKELYCRLCARYFVSKHKMRPLAAERQRQYKRKRKLSEMASPLPIDRSQKRTGNVVDLDD